MLEESTREHVLLICTLRYTFLLLTVVGTNVGIVISYSLLAKLQINHEQQRRQHEH